MLSPIHLQPGDELPSVIDQLRSLEPRHIALVAPDKHPLLQSLVNLKLLQRNSNKLRKELVVITHDPIAQKIASQADLPVYKSVTQAQGELFPETIQAPPPQPHISTTTTHDAIAKTTPHTQRETQLTESVTPSPPFAPKPQSTEFTESREEPEPVIHLADEQELTGDQPNTREEGTLKSTPTASFGLQGAWKKTKQRVQNLQQRVLPPSPKRQQWREEYVTLENRKFVFFLLGLAILPFLLAGYAAASILPYGEVVIVPQTENFESTFEIQASDRYETIDYVNNYLPSRVYEITESRTETGQATQSESIGSSSNGLITIFNQGYSEGISLAKGTLVTSYDGKIFELNGNVEVPPLRVEGGEEFPGQASNVPVTSQEVGEEFNIRETNFTIEGFDQDIVWAESYENFSGGLSRQGTVLGQDDIDQLRTRMLQSLIPENETKVRNQLASDHEFLPNSIRSEQLNETVNAAIGDEVDSFSMTITLRTRGVSMNAEELTALVQRQMENALPSYGEPLANEEWSVSYQIVNVSDDYRNIDILASGAGRIAYKLSSQTILNSLAGKNEVDAGIYLDSQPGVENYFIDYGPFWVDALPDNLDKLTIEKMSQEEFNERFGED